MYDQTKTLTLTGMLTSLWPRPIMPNFTSIWLDRRETARDKDASRRLRNGNGGAAAGAARNYGREFPAGVVFSVKLNPLRDGSNFGSKAETAPSPMPNG
jgi:hypothetical protein